MDNLISISKAAKLLGRHPDWLRKNDKLLGLTVYRILSNHRRYNEAELLAIKAKMVSGKTLKVE